MGHKINPSLNYVSLHILNRNTKKAKISQLKKILIILFASFQSSVFSATNSYLCLPITKFNSTYLAIEYRPLNVSVVIAL